MHVLSECIVMLAFIQNSYYIIKSYVVSLIFVSLSLLFASNSQFSIASFICKIFFVLLIYQFKTNHRLLLQISPSSNNGNKKRQPRKLSCNNKHTMVSGWRNDNIRSKKSETIHSKSLLHMMIIITQKQYEIWEAIVI